ncbi:MAG: hypothetical protein KDB61_03925 [Planctomycetes bacterium]|nr:hypothetical protein [Planctomycetota bacterium]
MLSGRRVGVRGHPQFGICGAGFGALGAQAAAGSGLFEPTGSSLHILNVHWGSGFWPELVGFVVTLANPVLE